MVFRLGLQVPPIRLSIGSSVWVQDPEVAWVDGEVVEVIGEEIKVKSISGNTVSSFIRQCLKL